MPGSNFHQDRYYLLSVAEEVSFLRGSYFPANFMSSVIRCCD